MHERLTAVLAVPLFAYGGHLTKRKFMYASGQATPCFQWFTRLKYEQSSELILDKQRFPILLKTRRLIEHFRA
jgi:hypothetical protein